MCFVVGALRRAMLIHARVVLSADDFYGRKSDQSLFPSIFFFFLYIPLFRCYFICSLWKKEEILVSIGGQRNMYHLSSNSCFSRVFVFSVSINLLLSCSLHVHLSLSLSLSLSLFLSYCLPLVWEHDLLYIMPLLFSRERITRNVTV